MLATFCAETTATTGTGNITLAGGVPGAVTVNSVFSDDTTNAGIPFQYTIRSLDGTQTESGIGHMTAPTIMARDVPEGAATNFSAGTKIVSVEPIGRGILPSTPAIYTSATAKRVGSGAPLPGTIGTGTLQADVTYYVPYYKHFYGPATGIWMRGTAGAGGNIRLGIYAYKPSTGGPGDLYNEAGTVAPASTAFVDKAFGASLSLPPGWYFLAVVLDATAAALTWNVITGAADEKMGILGQSGALNNITSLTDVRTYASGSLNATPGALSVVTTSRCPILGLTA